MGSGIIYNYAGPPVHPDDLALRPLYFDSSPVLSPSPSTAEKQHAKDIIEPNIPTIFLAGNRVFNTIELLEQILEKCLFVDLLTRLPRVSSTWKRVIDHSKYIQQHLFFIPWGSSDYMERWGQVNPFMKNLAYKKGDNYGGRTGCHWGPSAKQNEDEDTDDDADESPWEPDWLPDTYFVFNNRLLETDPRLMYENASWRRMLPIQPPNTTVWTVRRPKLKTPIQKWMRSIRNKGKLLGEIYEDMLLVNKDPACFKIRIYIRSSERYGVITQMDITLWAWPEEGEHTLEAGDTICKIRGGVSWLVRQAPISEVVFEEWGKTPWLALLDQEGALDDE